MVTVYPTTYVAFDPIVAVRRVRSFLTRNGLATKAHPTRVGAAKPRVSCFRTTAGLPNQLTL
jgi:hypothetical protein